MHVVIVVTDGWTGWPDAKVRPKTVVCLTEEPPACYPVPEWATKVLLRD